MLRRAKRQQVLLLRGQELRTVNGEERLTSVNFFACVVDVQLLDVAVELRRDRVEPRFVDRHPADRADRSSDRARLSHAGLHADELLPRGRELDVRVAVHIRLGAGNSGVSFVDRHEVHAAVGRDSRLVRLVRRVHRVDPVEDFLLRGFSLRVRAAGRGRAILAASEQHHAEGDRENEAENPGKFGFHRDHLIDFMLEELLSAPDDGADDCDMPLPAPPPIDGAPDIAVGWRLASSIATRHFALSARRPA